MHILLNWILQGAVMAAATAVGLRLLRGAPAAARHLVCWAALLAILALPFVPSLWSVVAAITPAAPPASPTAVATAATSSAAADPAMIAGNAALVRLPASFSATSILLGAAWMLWMMLQGVRVLRDVRWLHRARRRCKRLPAIVVGRFSAQTIRLAAQTHARVALCDAVRAAAVLGGGRPLIGVQPRLVRELTDRELNAVLVHELTHVLRHDARATVIQRAVHVMVGWHPGVSWLLRQITLEREMACDEAALAEAGGPKAYATCLTRIAALTRTSARSPELAMGMLAASGLRQRVLHILTPAHYSRRIAGIAGGALATGLCALSAAVGMVAVFGAPVVANTVANTVADAAVDTLADTATDTVADAAAARVKAVTTRRLGTHAAPPRNAAPAAIRQAGTQAVGTPETPATRQPERTSAAPTVSNDDPGPAPAQSADVPATPVVPAAHPAAPDQAPVGESVIAPAPATPATPRELTVTDVAVGAAVGTAAGATEAWNATTGAAASTGVAVGRGTQRSAVKTAGAFARWGRRIASSF